MAEKAKNAVNGLRNGKNGTSHEQGSDSSTPTWTQLPFYDVSPIRDSSDFARSPAIFRTPSTIACVAQSSVKPAFTEVSAKKSQDTAQSSVSIDVTNNNLARKRLIGGGCVLVGTVSGEVCVCDTEDYSRLGSWTAFRGISSDTASGLSSGRVTHIECDNAGRVITLGEDEGARFPILRIWDLKKSVKNIDGGPNCPRLLAEAKVQHGSKPYPIAAIAHTPSSSFLAIGLADGTVLLLRNLSEALDNAHKVRSNEVSSSSTLATLPKFKVVHQASSKEEVGMDSVTGLGFSEDRPIINRQQQNHSQKPTGPAPRSKQRKRLDPATNYTAGLAEPDAGEAISTRQSDATIHLFIVCLSKILRYTVLGKGAGTPASSIDDVGCALQCAAIISPKEHPLQGEKDKMAGKMIVARDEAIYVVGSEGREMSLAFEGKKSAIRLCSTQLIIISPPVPATAASASATVRHYVAERNRSSSPAIRSNEVSKVTVFDLESKLVAHSSTFEGGIRDVWSGPEGEVCVLCDDGSLTRLDEKSLRQKLDILLRKSLYLLAVSVATSHAARSRTKHSRLSEHANIGPLLGDIHRKYGDYLYEKGDFEGAVSQFVKTIGVTQPSYVIRKFLDAQRITNLTTYLQELHSRGLANADHTTLLLNCFAKLKDVASLDKFIKRPIEKGSDKSKHMGDDVGSEDGNDDEEEAGGVDELPFDLETAIRVCRQAGYYQHAAYLAQRYNQPDEYVRIQIQDLNDYANAMQYIRSLPINEAQRNLQRYGRAMLDHDEDATTNLLIELCSGAFQPTPIAEGSGIDATNMDSKNAYLNYLKVGRFGVGASNTNKQSTDLIVNPKDQKTDIHFSQEDTSAQISPPSPCPFFAHFLDHQFQFIRFLETVALARWDQAITMNSIETSIGLPEPIQIETDSELEDEGQRDQRTIWNTLLELYLSYKEDGGEANSSFEKVKNHKIEHQEADVHKRKALAMLHQYDSIPYDVAHALVLCSQYSFDEGTILLYERLGMYEDVLRLFMEREDRLEQAKQREDAQKEGKKMLDALKRYGAIESDLYPLVLRHLVSSEDRLKVHNNDVEEILTYIFDEGLLSPLEVVQLLSKDGIATVGLLRDHLMRALDAQQNDIETNAKLNQTYRIETKEKQEEIDALCNIDQPRVFQQSRCSSCGGTLDLPSIHFMCKHSFHGRCLGDGENECPLCAQSHGVILEIRRNNVQFGQRHDLFINEVEEAEDGFDVVASMFSKGLFGAQQLGQS